MSRCELLITFISLIFFRSPCFGLDTDSIKIIPALNKELISQQEKLFHQLKTTWQQVVLFSSQDVSKGKKTTNSITIRGVSQPGESKERISELLQALNHMELLDALFANKLSQELLTTARDIMKEDLFVTVPITEDSLSPLPPAGVKTDEVQKKEEEELPVPPDFPLPEQLFQFPACSVSASTMRLLELADSGLEQAAASAQPFCSVRLFNTVRNVLELWCAVVPTYHKAKLESLPQVAAVAHNSAMYLAHRCVTLGFLFRDRLPSLAQHSLTFIDIVPRYWGRYSNIFCRYTGRAVDPDLHGSALIFSWIRIQEGKLKKKKEKMQGNWL